MTLKTLKKDKRFSLTIDDEFIQYCELNKIEDIEKLARETFNRGFSLLKYGSKPDVEIKPSPITKEAQKEAIIKVIREDESNNLYSE